MKFKKEICKMDFADKQTNIMIFYSSRDWVVSYRREVKNKTHFGKPGRYQVIQIDR